MLVVIEMSNATIFDRLIQEYEEEFSPITGKQKQGDGKYALDSDWREPNEGFYWLQNEEVVGFAIIGREGEYWDVREFYIVPTFRKQGVGETFAKAVFDRHEGHWQVRQIAGADIAKAFWRKVVDKYSLGSFEEVEESDSYWGSITCQRFEKQ